MQRLGAGHAALLQPATLLLRGALEGHAGQLFSEVFEPLLACLSRHQVCEGAQHRAAACWAQRTCKEACVFLRMCVCACVCALPRNEETHLGAAVAEQSIPVHGCAKKLGACPCMSFACAWYHVCLRYAFLTTRWFAFSWKDYDD